MADPTWLPDVLRAAGLKCNIYPGAFERGHGDFGTIWGPFMHHTGSYGASPGSIAEHPSLGLASQLHLATDGTYTLCGVGTAWHAGVGSWPGLPTNNANSNTIGIEAANDGTGGWAAAQYDAYLRGIRAINRKLGNPLNKVVAHKEYGAIQGKWDPGGIDVNRFRQQLLVDDAAPPLPPVNMINAQAKIDAWVGRRRFNDGEEWHVGADLKGRMVEFDNAHIYWSINTGAHAIPHADPNVDHSGLFEAYALRGFERGPLGYPVRHFDIIETATFRGAVQAFQGGVMYIRDGHPAVVVKGVIGQRWATEGYEKGRLGWPLTDEIPNGTGGVIQMFEFGSLEWDPQGAVLSIGPAATRDLTLVNAAGIPLALEAVQLVAA